MPVIYTPLKHDNAQIRVLKLQDARVKTPESQTQKSTIACSLQEVSLDDAPDFIALSYVWGTELALDPIVVDGEQIQVTLNLRDALMWYQGWRSEVPIWIDAICIDQVNLDEKSTQIRLMSRIYQEAMQVLCWLGPSTPRIELYLQYGMKLAASLEQFTRSTIFYRRIYPRIGWAAFATKMLVSTQSITMVVLIALQIYNGQTELDNLPYFQRIWTFQESLLPGENAIFVLGGRIRHYSPWTAGIAYLPRAIHDQARRIIHGKSNRKRVSTQDMPSRIEQELSDPLYTNLSSGWLKLQRFYAYTFRALDGSSLAFLLLATSRRICKDPRDKIFGVIGLLKDPNPESTAIADARRRYLAVDYTKSVENVFLDALYYINQFEQLDVVAVIENFKLRNAPVCLGEDGEPLEDGMGHGGDVRSIQASATAYPSWLPDITRPLASFHVLKHSGQCKTILERRRFRERELNLLIFDGKILGRIANVLAFPKKWEAAFTMFEDLITGAHLLQKLSAAEKTWALAKTTDNEEQERLKSLHAFMFPIKPAEDLPMRLCRALVSVEGIDLARLLQQANSDSGESSVTARKMIANSFFGEALFILDNGRFGRCTANVRVGDLAISSIVWSTPLILREVEVSERDSLDTGHTNELRNWHRLVDRVYIDGLMCGARGRQDRDYMSVVSAIPDQRVVLI